jgi:probable HAF family extracellular repeat protein
MRSRISALPLALAFSLCAWQAHAQETYRLTKIEGLTEFFGGLNNKGVVVGATHAANGATHAAIWKDGQLTDVHDRIDSNAVQSDLRDINERGDAVGSYVDSTFHGFLMSGKRVAEIRPPQGDESLFALELNDRRQVIANSIDANLNSRQSVWDRGQFTFLQGLGGQTFSIEPVQIQNAGIVVGIDHQAQRAVTWQDGTIMDIGGLPGSFSNRGQAINERGQIAGESVMTDPNVFPQQVTVFIWQDGVATALPSLYPGRADNAVRGFNKSGVAVGASLAEFAEQTTAAVWQDGAVYDLNQLIDPQDPLKPGLVLSAASAINDRGQIVASTVNPELGLVEFYLLTPVK